MTFESQRRKDIPNLTDSDDEWTKYWGSCSINEIVNTLEKLIQMDRKRGLSKINPSIQEH